VRIAREIAFALFGLFAASAILRPLVPYPEMAAGRMEEIERRRQELNVLFIGPSYVGAQIDTDVFDRKMKELGHEVRSAKFAMGALRSYELRFWLNRLLEMDFPGLKWVVIDITLSNSPRVASRNRLKGRMIYWHDWSAVRWLYDYYEGNKKLAREKKRDAAAGHLAHLGAHYFNVGQGVEMIRLSRFWQAPFWKRGNASDEEQDEEADEEAELERSPWLLFGGTEAEQERPAKKGKKTKRKGKGEKKKKARRARSRREAKKEGKLKGKVLKRYQERRAKLLGRRKRKRVKYSSPGYALRLRNVAREHGTKAIFVIAPVPRLRKTPRIKKGDDQLVVFNFTDPITYPELYEVKHRRDHVHLTEEGSRLYTETLAEKISKHWKSKGMTDAIH
jgi:hypothetical protein